MGDRVAAAEDLLDGADREDGGACVDGVAGLGGAEGVGRTVGAMGGVGSSSAGGAGCGGGAGHVVLAGESGGDAVEGRRAVAIEGHRRARIGRTRAEGRGGGFGVHFGH